MQTYFLPVIGLVDPENLSPGDLVVGPCVVISGLAGRRLKCVHLPYSLTFHYREWTRTHTSYWTNYPPSKPVCCTSSSFLNDMFVIAIVELCVYYASCTCVLCGCFSRYDSRVKAMELDERPTEQYSDIGGLDKQIEEVQQHPPTCVISSTYVQVLTCVVSILLSSWWKLLCCQWPTENDLRTLVFNHQKVCLNVTWN